MEEDIKILEELVQNIKRVNERTLDCEVEQWSKEKQAIENLIKGYREYKNFYHRRLKEWRTKFENQEKHFLNELDEYDEEREKLKKQLENCIPKSKIKEKIEELNKEEKDLRNSISAEEYAEYSDANISFNLMHIEIQRKVLQELIED